MKTKSYLIHYRCASYCPAIQNYIYIHIAVVSENRPMCPRRENLLGPALHTAVPEARLQPAYISFAKAVLFSEFLEKCAIKISFEKLM